MHSKNHTPEKEIRFSITLPGTTITRMETLFPLAGARSRNDYIKKAIQFYNVYLQLDGDPDVFTKILGDIVEAKMKLIANQAETQRRKDVEQLARNQFKIATELAKIALIMVDNLNVPKERMTEWHVKAIEEVRSLNGILGFADRLD